MKKVVGKCRDGRNQPSPTPPNLSSGGMVQSGGGGNGPVADFQNWAVAEFRTRIRNIETLDTINREKDLSFQILEALWHVRLMKR